MELQLAYLKRQACLPRSAKHAMGPQLGNRQGLYTGKVPGVRRWFTWKENTDTGSLTMVYWAAWFFLNGESFSAAPGTKLQAVQPGFGPGMRVKLNKLSNTNITIDYGFGRQGSKGLFIDVGEAF